MHIVPLRLTCVSKTLTARLRACKHIILLNIHLPGSTQHADEEQAKLGGTGEGERQKVNK